MKLADHARRAISVVLAAACFVVVPSIATASFTDRSNVTVEVGTATIQKPELAEGRYNCSLVLWAGVIPVAEALEVNIDRVAAVPENPHGSVLVYRLHQNGEDRAQASAIPSAPAATLRGRQDRIDGAPTKWTLEVRAKYENWTSPPAVATITCPWGGTGSGRFEAR